MQKVKIGLICILTISMCLLGTSRTMVKVSAQGDSWAEGKAECVVEVSSGRILYASNVETALPMASTTKIATAITVLEHCDNLQEQIRIPKQAAGVEGSSVYLQEGDVYSVEDLLYGLMLRSGNDCAVALALHVGKSIENFSTLINQTAEKAGALRSHFCNPHGLPCDGHYTTALDLSYITCYALKNPIFQTIVSTRFYQPRQWANKNKLLRMYDGANGVKTGYTKQAGRCLVSSATKNGMQLVCTLLNCPTTYERSIQLFNDAFTAYKMQQIVTKGEKFSIKIGKKSVDCATTCSYSYPLLEEEKRYISVHTNAVLPYIDDQGREIIGQFQIYLAKQLLFLGNLYKL